MFHCSMQLQIQFTKKDEKFLYPHKNKMQTKIKPWFILQAVNDQGIEVYEYYLTYRWGSSDLAEWQGVTHSADLKVSKLIITR